MGACHLQCLLLLSLLAFPPCPDALTCHKGIMLKSGSNFLKTPIEWKPFGTTQSAPGEICQETLLLIGVGEKSLILGSKGCSNAGDEEIKDVRVYSSGPEIVAASYVNFCDTDLCNGANSSSVLLASLSPSATFEPGTTKCPVCLELQSSCSHESNIVFCPKGTGCYTSELKVQGGGLNAIFSIDGCLVFPANNLFEHQNPIGIFTVTEAPDLLTGDSVSHILVPRTSRALMLGLGLLSSLCLEGFVLSAEPLSLPFFACWPPLPSAPLAS